MRSVLFSGLLGLSVFAADPALTGPLDALKSDDVLKKRAAIEQLGALGEKASEARAALLETLAHRDPTVRAGGAWALGKISPTDPAVIGKLVEATGESDWTVRHNAALSLLRSGKAAEPMLKRQLQSTNAWQKFYAADTLSQIDKAQAELALPTFIEALKSDDSEMISRASGAVARMGEGGRSAVPALIPLFQHPQAKVRSAAVAAAQSLRSKEAVAEMAKLVEKEKESFIRTAMYAAMGVVGEPREAIIPALITGLQDKKDQPISAATEAVALIGEPAIPALLKAVADRKGHLGALDALGRMKPMPKEAAPLMIKMLGDEEWAVRLRAATALGNIGEASPEAIRALEKAAADRHEGVRAHAAESLKTLKDRKS